MTFAEQVAKARPPVAPRADAIVALTGGAERIDEAVELLARGSGDRLLISGVGEKTSAEALSRGTPALRRFIGCCVDIGYQAQDTHGNATETRDWALRQGYRSIIVVTAAYHMPRSLAEFSRALPDVELIPYPIRPATFDFSNWTSDPRTFRLLAREYVKYLVTRFA